MPKQTLALVRSGLTAVAVDYAMYVLQQSRGHTMIATIDEMFTTGDGEKNFNPRLLGAAHDYCYGRTIRGLASGADVIVVNPFSTRREVARYVTGVNRAFGKDVEVRVINCAGFPFADDVPNTVQSRLIEKWEPWAGEIFVEQFNSEGITYVLENGSVNTVLRAEQEG